MTGLYYYKLISPYSEDVTKNCKLTVQEIDHNFVTLKDNDIKKVEFVRGEDCAKSDGTLVITKNNDEKLIVPIDVTICKNLTYDLKVSTGECASGASLTLSYKDDSGETSVTLDNIITADNLIDVIGSDVLTKVISDNTLIGLGTMNSPLGLAGVEKTGMLAPAIKLLDLTDGSRLPKNAAKGTRYVTKEYVSDYGYLYNGNGVSRIQGILDTIYQNEEVYKEVEDRKYYWRVPSKEDWDKLLNSIEPCRYRNHNSANCHAELGKYAGTFLKSECGWIGQSECKCDGTKPHTGCTVDNLNQQQDENYIDDAVLNEVPDEQEVSPIGIDKYGMKVLPAGVSVYRNDTPQASGFKEMAAFWTTTHIYNDLGQDIYIKRFDYDRSGVYQLAECPEPYYSIRLVKDYDGSNYRDIEYIDGVAYKTILFPESKQVWFATNVANVLDKVGGTPDYLEPNNGVGISDKRVEMFINEYNGRYWEKKVMDEGMTIVIQNPCFDKADDITEEVCWKDSGGSEHCVEVIIPKISQNNVEYRVYMEDESCDKTLVNTDDLVAERILNIIVPMIDEERWEREAADALLQEEIEAESSRAQDVEQQLWDAISQEAEARENVDQQLWEAIAQEASARTDVDNQLWDAIAQEASARTDVDNQLWEALNEEIDARSDVDSQLWKAINEEASARTDVDNQLWDAISQEAAAREEVDNQQWDAINLEAQIREEIDNQQWDAINNEIARAKAREDEIECQLVDNSEAYTLNVNGGLTLKSKCEGANDITIQFNADFGNF